MPGKITKKNAGIENKKIQLGAGRRKTKGISGHFVRQERIANGVKVVIGGSRSGRK